MLHLREFSSRDVRVSTDSTTGNTTAMSNIRFGSGANQESEVEA